jgi:hypothetical protein
LRCTNGVVNFAPAQTTGAAVWWNWIESLLSGLVFADHDFTIVKTG